MGDNGDTIDRGACIDNNGSMKAKKNTEAIMNKTEFPARAQNWFRGQLHVHSYWSDGRGFSEQAIDAYKQRGYDFMSISDHNRFGEDMNAWREVVENEGGWPPKISQAIFDTYLQTFGDEWVESKTSGANLSVRLKTYWEVKPKFEESGKFILLAGVEVTQTLNGLHAHLNYINLPLILPCIKDAGLIKTVQGPKTISELIALNAQEADQAANELHKPYILTLNHPFWVYYDVVPQNLIDCSEIRFLEICSGGSDHAPYPQASTYTVEKFWDVVNAFRLAQGHPILYGTGSDDAHFYDAERINGIGGVGEAWIMVHAASLTPEHLTEAMYRGDFYASNGVLLEKVEFTRVDKTLRLAVKAEHGVNYRIRFITTKRGFDQSVNWVEIPAGKSSPARTVPLYSDDIGRTVKTVAGTEATYQLEGDDLYVRACVESDSPSMVACHFHPKVKLAWTQPYAAEEN